MNAEEDGSVPEKVWFLIRETSGVGDFIGTEGKPTPMKPHEVEKLVGEAEKGGPAAKVEQPAQTGPAEKASGALPKSETPAKPEPAAKAEPQPAKEVPGPKK